MTEKEIQFTLYKYLEYRLHHKHITPNSKSIFDWEADIVSVTNSGYVYEFEIKRTLADYRADFKKEEKHSRLKNRGRHIPSRFWYVINGFELPVDAIPEYAGLIIMTSTSIWDDIHIIKRAPRLTTSTIEPKYIDKLNEAAYSRMWSLLEKFYIRDTQPKGYTTK